MPINRRRLLGGLASLPLLHAAPTLAAASAGGRLAGAARLTEVDPFIGTDGTGHCFPGPCRPFGMVQPGPDNAAGGWDYTSGYQYRAPRILGFSQTRASGTGIPELGDLLLQPMLEPRSDFSSAYDKASEVATPGYYAVTLGDHGCRVELTCGLRVALHRYRFARGGRVWVLVDCDHRLRFRTDECVTAAAVAVTADGVEGTVQSRNWTTRTVAFVLRFDHPVAEWRELPRRPGQIAPRFLLAFDLGSAALLHAKTALSTVDLAGAHGNLAELPDWNFDRLVTESQADWAALLARAEIDGDARTRRIFATSLYHLCLQPSTISDVDGRYRGPDGSIRRARGRVHYSTLSLWDTFRAAHQLYALLVPERVDDFILTMLDHHAAQGYLPIWTIWGGETWCMIGNPALPVIADAWARGFRGFDGREALAAMVQTATTNHPLADWNAMDRYGYYPFDQFPNEAVSRTLEAGIGDAATAHMAAMLGEPAIAARFAKRAGNYRLLLDPVTGLARGRDSAGRWREPFDPLQATSPLGVPGDYTEANAWQYSWSPALHDPAGLIAAMGGKQRFAAMLDRFFTLKHRGTDRHQGQEGLIGQYAHGNEPSHHIAWLYAHCGQPARAARLVRQIAGQFYGDTPSGITGNDDCGQMSAWYILATLGLYPDDVLRGRWRLGSPLVREARIAPPGEAALHIERSARSCPALDGRPAGATLSHTALARSKQLLLPTLAD